MRNFLGLTLVVVIALGYQTAGASECPALQDSATIARELLEQAKAKAPGEVTYAKPYLSKFLYWGSANVKWSGCPTQLTYSLPITLIYRVGHVECEVSLEAFKYQTIDELGRTQASYYKVKGFGKKEVCLDDR